jgi:hypothetical protein
MGKTIALRFENLSFRKKPSLYALKTLNLKLTLPSLGPMKRLDQGHLQPLQEHPETNMPRPGIKPGPPASQASTLAKSYSIRTAYAAIKNLYSP